MNQTRIDFLGLRGFNVSLQKKSPGRSHDKTVGLALVSAGVMAILLLGVVIFAQEWDVNSVRTPGTVLEYEAMEGSWISVDVAPDGRQIVFDLLGHLYEMPVEGGLAVALTSGHSWNMFPRYSPDGRWVAFTSDRGGTEAIWVLDRASRALRKVSTLNRPVYQSSWSRDSRFLYATVFDIKGRTQLLQLSAGGGQEVMWDAGVSPAVCPAHDAVRRAVYFERNTRVSGRTRAAIMRFDLRTGAMDELIEHPIGVSSPTLSPDGQRLAYLRRDDLETVLMVRDLESGQERVVLRGLDRGRFEALLGEFVYGAYSNLSWHPNGSELFLSFGGRIVAVDMERSTVRRIPFRAPVRREIESAVRFPTPVADGLTQTRAHRWAKQTDRGILFETLGDLWLKEGSRAINLTNSSAHETSPVYDRRSGRLFYVGWSDNEFGAIYSRLLKGGRAQRLAQGAGQYGALALSSDGGWFAYLKGAGALFAGRRLEEEKRFKLVMRSPEGREIDLAIVLWNEPEIALQYGGSGRLGAPSLSFSRDQQRIYFTELTGDTLRLKRIGVDGQGETTLALFPFAVEAVVSPDERWIAFRERHRLYVAPLYELDRPAIVNVAEEKGNTIRVDVSGEGYDLGWSEGSDTLFWTLGSSFQAKALADILTGTNRHKTVDLSVSFEAVRPLGTVALLGVRVVTMNSGREVLEDATIVVCDNRIEAIGRGVSIPTSARVYDLPGRTVIPGIIDVHAHYGSALSPLGIIEQQVSSLQAYLAHGVTSIYDVFGNSRRDFWLSDLQRAGGTVGARLFSTGYPVYGLLTIGHRPVGSEADAQEYLNAYTALGATAIKEYGLFSRAARQQVIDIARRQDLNVYGESWGSPPMSFSMILDGFTVLEHTPGLTPLYEDIRRLFAAGKTGMDPTLIVVYNGPTGEYIVQAEERLWENPKLLRFFRRDELFSGKYAGDARRPMQILPDEHYALEVARELLPLHRAGVILGLGGHGNRFGRDSQWELELLVRGGFQPHEALEIATLNSARLRGLDGQLGSLEKGKLADLVVLEGNPLKDIRHIRSVEYVMQNGVLYRGDDLARVHPNPQPAEPMYFLKHSDD